MKISKEDMKKFAKLEDEMEDAIIDLDFEKQDKIFEEMKKIAKKYGRRSVMKFEKELGF